VVSAVHGIRAVSLIHFIMENQQNKMYEYDVNDAELNEIYEAILRQQAVGTDEGRKN